MSRNRINVTPQELQRLEAMAALESVLDQRIQEAETKGNSSRNVSDIFQQAREELI